MKSIKLTKEQVLFLLYVLKEGYEQRTFYKSEYEENKQISFLIRKLERN